MILYTGSVEQLGTLVEVYTTREALRKSTVYTEKSESSDWLLRSGLTTSND